MGILYNGRLIRQSLLGSSNSAVYIILPTLYKECNITDSYKIGFTGGQSTRSSLAERMGTYATSFVSFEIIGVIIYQRVDPLSQHNVSSIAENEIFAFLKSRGAERRIHVSGKRESEWFVNTSKELVRDCFNHLLDIGTPALSKWNYKPQPFLAIWFGDEVSEFPNDGDIPDKYFVKLSRVGENDRARRTIVRKLKAAESRGDTDEIQALKKELDELLRGYYDDISSLEIVDKSDDVDILAVVDQSSSSDSQSTTNDSVSNNNDDSSAEVDDGVVEDVMSIFGGGISEVVKEKRSKRRGLYNLRSSGMQLRNRRISAIDEEAVITFS